MIWRTKTFLFSDRPNRIVVTETTQDFVSNWTSGGDSFQVDPPNAVLVVLTDDQEDDVLEIELFIRHTMRMKSDKV